jgi:uncharacterized lipoprotein YehR (DUF1307 family)
MRGFKQLALVLTFLITALGCENDTLQSAPVAFQFKLLNSQNEPSVSFSQGENFIFSFIVINRSNEDIYLKQSSLNTIEFLKVYLTNSNEANPVVAIGKPYKSLFCTYQNGILIPANDTLKLEIPWIPLNDGCCSHFCLVEDNSPLPHGKYRTGFSSSFEFFKGDKSFKTAVNSFKIDFEVQ